MGRIPPEEIERIKKNIDLAALIRAKGIELKPHGKNLVGRCPFHDDTNPSLVVTPSKGLWHCLGACGTGGDVIAWVMKVEGLSFRHAVELLRNGSAAALLSTDGLRRKGSVRRLPSPIKAEADGPELLSQVVEYYHETLKATPAALAYLEGRGIKSDEAIDTFKLGFADRTLGLRIPLSGWKDGRQMRSRLQAVGVYRESGHEHFNGSVTIPVFDAAGAVVGLYGRKITNGLRPGTLLHMYLPGEHKGIWNPACLASNDVILCEALIDALTFWVNGYKNVTASYGVNGFTEEHLAGLLGHGVRRVYIAYDNDEAGDEAAGKLALKLMMEGLECLRVKFPRGMDANEYACKVKPAAQSLRVALNGAEWLGRTAKLWVAAPGSGAPAEPAPAAPAAAAAVESESAAAVAPSAPAAQESGSPSASPETAAGAAQTPPAAAASSAEPAFSLGAESAPASATEPGPVHATPVSFPVPAPASAVPASPSAAADRAAAPSAPAAPSARHIPPPAPATVPQAQPSAPAAYPLSASLFASSPAPLSAPAAPRPGAPVPCEFKGGDVLIALGDRAWRIRGFSKEASHLRVNMRVSLAERFHVDTIDMYNAKHRQGFLAEAAAETGADADVLKRDLGRILLKLEELRDAARAEAQGLKLATSADQMTDAERAEAIGALRSPTLLEDIFEAYAACGIAGERVPLLVGHLAGISRKLDDPLAILIQSSSAAGKTSLMDALLAFIPEDDKVRFTAMSGQSLFYMGETDLVHKTLAISEEEGAMRARYAIKTMQSEKCLRMASTIKNPKSGRHEAAIYAVPGPTQFMVATTSNEVDEELQNRCLVLTVDEGREQTQAIHRLQRERETLDGLRLRQVQEAITRRQQNMQRALRPLSVVNPYANELTFLDTHLRSRRDHMKYLALIRVMAFLHQYQREVKTMTESGRVVSYIEVTLEDIAMTNELADVVLGRSLDELAGQTRRFLDQVLEMVKAESARQEMEPRQYRFTRREAREYTRQSNTATRKHLERLIELEYVIVHHGTNGQQFVYELLYQGEGNEKKTFMMGLLDVKELSKRGGSTSMMSNLAPQNGHLAPTLHPPCTHLAPTLHPDNFEPTSGSDGQIITAFEKPSKTHVTREKKEPSYSYTQMDGRSDIETPPGGAASVAVGSGQERALGAAAPDGSAAECRGDRAAEGEARGAGADVSRTAGGGASGGPSCGCAAGATGAEVGADARAGEGEAYGGDAGKGSVPGVAGEPASGGHIQGGRGDLSAPMAEAV